MKEQYFNDNRRNGRNLILVVILLCACFFLSLCVGRYVISLSDMLQAFFGDRGNETVNQILYYVRIPRVVASMLIGGSLAVSGAAYQGLFKNPLVSPDLLGASAGAGFGAALGILLGFGLIGIKGWSFALGIVAVFLAWFISSRFGKGDDSYFLLILSGILVGTVFQSLLSAVKYLADPQEQLPAITFWLMGSLAKVTSGDLLVLFLPFAIGCFVLYFLSFQLNVMSFGEEEAKTMGIHTTSLRFIVVIMATVMTSSSVSICGMIGWVGLVIPHLARMIVGPNFKWLIPASMLLGSLYLMLVDDLARSIAIVEIPLGILTSLIGVPFFIFLLMQRKKGW